MSVSTNRKWKPGQAAKFRKTMKAKAAAKRLAERQAKSTKVAKPIKNNGGTHPNIMDAVVYLDHARSWINTSIAAGTLKKPDEAHLLMQIALGRLERVQPRK